MTDEPMPTAGSHRGVPLHRFQTQERIERVKKAIDGIMATIDDLPALFDLAGDVLVPPEARLYARARIIAEHESRPSGRAFQIDMEQLRAHTAGLTLRWMSPWLHCSMLDNWHPNFGDVEPRSPGHRDQLLAAKGR